MSHILNINSSVVTDAPQHDLGGVGTDDQGNEWMYIKANGAIVLRDFVVITPGSWLAESADIAHTDDRIGAPCGIAAGTAFTDDDYGWVQRTGASTARARASCAAYALLTSQATTADGEVDDNTTSGSEILEGIVLTTARGSSNGTAPCWLDRPYVGATR